MSQRVVQVHGTNGLGARYPAGHSGQPSGNSIAEGRQAFKEQVASGQTPRVVLPDGAGVGAGVLAGSSAGLTVVSQRAVQVHSPDGLDASVSVAAF